MVNEYRIGDCTEVMSTLPDGFAQCCITSPPYWGLRDYGCAGQIGIEETPQQYVGRMVEVFEGVRRVLRDDGTLWLNLGDSYAGAGLGGGTESQGLNKSSKRHAGSSRRGARPLRGNIKTKDMVGIPWTLALALRDAGWYLRSDIIWHKPNPMPESVYDRPTKAHEYLFLLSKSKRYYYDLAAVREPVSGTANPRGSNVGPKSRANAFGSAQNESYSNAISGVVETRNRRSVWTVPTRPYSGAHFACYPPDLIRPCVIAGCPPGGMVLDPFFGSGTTGMVAESLGRCWFGIELNPEYEPLIRERTAQVGLL